MSLSIHPEIHLRRGELACDDFECQASDRIAAAIEVTVYPVEGHGCGEKIEEQYIDVRSDRLPPDLIAGFKGELSFKATLLPHRLRYECEVWCGRYLVEENGW